MLSLPVSGQGGAAFVFPGEWRQELPDHGSAEMLALWGVSPYRELWQAGLPLPPSPAERDALPDRVFMQQQQAMKQVLMARELRARAARHRVTRANWQLCAAEARELGAPAAWVRLLELRASDELSSTGRYLVDTALSHMLTLYRVDEQEVRYFMQSRALPSEGMEALADWFPLPFLFNMVPPSGTSAEAVAGHDLALLAALNELAILYSRVHDRAGADAVAAAMPLPLARFLQSSRALGYAPDALRLQLRARYASLAAQAEGNWLRQRRRVAEADYFGSERLRALDFFMD